MAANTAVQAAALLREWRELHGRSLANSQSGSLSNNTAAISFSNSARLFPKERVF
jgi:hypothetical protein